MIAPRRRRRRFFRFEISPELKAQLEELCAITEGVEIMSARSLEGVTRISLLAEGRRARLRMAKFERKIESVKRA